MEILGPVTRSINDLNNSSVIAKLAYKNMSFLFTGDAEDKAENQILQRGLDISSDILKVAHHGSYSSSTISFLREVDQDIAVISCGTGNKYGHPHDTTLKNLKDLGITIYRTDISGDIIIESDGETYNIIRGSPFAYSEEKPKAEEEPAEKEGIEQGQFVGSKNSDVFHYVSCGYVKRIKEENKVYFSSYDDAVSKEYRPCKVCKPVK